MASCVRALTSVPVPVCIIRHLELKRKDAKSTVTISTWTFHELALIGLRKPLQRNGQKCNATRACATRPRTSMCIARRHAVAAGGAGTLCNVNRVKHPG